MKTENKFKIVANLPFKFELLVDFFPYVYLEVWDEEANLTTNLDSKLLTTMDIERV